MGKQDMPDKISADSLNGQRQNGSDDFCKMNTIIIKTTINKIYWKITLCELKKN